MGPIRGAALNWKHAIGEVVLIVVGILIALAASEWQQDRALRQRELIVLGELEAALSADLVQLEGLLDRYRNIEVRVGSLLAHMRRGGPYADSLNAYFGTLYGFRGTQLNRAAYESLKSQGLDLISDDTLRSEVAQVYEQAYQRAELAMDAETRVILDLLRPYFLTHFRDLRFSESSVPLNYDAIIADTPFLNLVDYRIQLVTQNQIPNMEAAIRSIRELLVRLDAQVDR